MTTESIEFIVDGGSVAGSDRGVGGGINACVVAMQPSLSGTLAYANHLASNDLGAKSQLAHQDAMNRLRQSITADAVARVQDVDPVAARSAVVTLTSHTVAQQLAGLTAALRGFTGLS